MLDRSGTVKVLDMGLARFFDARRNQNLTRRFDARNILGTAEFIAPEQAINSSEVDTRADIYALGCTFYFLLLGRFPFEDGTALEKLKRHQTDAFDPVTRYRADVPAGLLAVLDKMVAKSPKDRYATPAELARALAPFDPGSRPPDAAELPPAETYRLGLCPPPLPGAVGSGLVPAPSATRAIQQQSTVVSRRGHDRAPAPSTPPAGGPIDFLAAPSGRGPGAGWRANFRDFGAAVRRMATLADGGRIDEGGVIAEIARLSARWGPGPSIGPLLDRFDRVQLDDVIAVCRASPSLSAAGRVLFAESIKTRASKNDADRLRKYLARFSLTFEALQ